MICLQRFDGETDKIARLSFDGFASHNRLEQLRAKRRIPDRVEQDGSLFACEMRDGRVRIALGNGARCFTGSNFYRDSIRFRRSIQIVYLNEPKSRAAGVGRAGKRLNYCEMAEGPPLGSNPA